MDPFVRFIFFIFVWRCVHDWILSPWWIHTDRDDFTVNHHRWPPIGPGPGLAITGESDSLRYGHAPPTNHFPTTVSSASVPLPIRVWLVFIVPNRSTYLDRCLFNKTDTRQNTNITLHLIFILISPMYRHRHYSLVYPSTVWVQTLKFFVRSSASTRSLQSERTAV